jgi:hypothetical protein
MSFSSRASGGPYLEWMIAFIGCSCVVTGLGERSCLVDAAQPLGARSKRITQQRGPPAEGVPGNRQLYAVDN